MFSNLVESGSHLKDLKRRSSFFIGTLVFYSVLLAAAGVGSIYAYHAHLDEQAELELRTMLRFPPQTAPAEEETRPRNVAPRRADTSTAGGSSRQPQVAIVTDESRNNPNLSNRPLARDDAPELPPSMDAVIGPSNIVPNFGGIGGSDTDNQNTRGTGSGPLVTPDTEVIPERRAQVQPKPEPPRGPVKLSEGVIAGKATNKPAPVYPKLALDARASGTVAVQILVDEQGRVVNAQATSGHPLLRKAAVEAAYRARFTPTLLSHQPVKVTGIIYYNFVLN